MRTILKTGGGEVAVPVAGLLVLLASILAACSSGSGPGSGVSRAGRIRVVVAENFWGSIAKQIAGSQADVTSVISNPSTDPHDYEPTPDDARSVASAQLVIENGIGYDPWMQQLVDADGSSGPAVLDVGKLLGARSGANPHQWYSRSSVDRVIARVAADLEVADSRHRSAYEHNERAFETNGLAEYDALIAKIKQQYSGTPIGASESIAEPLAETLGLELVTPEKLLDAISEGNEPTASDKATADAQIQQHRIAVFVFNSQNSTPDVQRLVDAAHRERIPVVTVTETPTPENTTFEAWQVRQLRALLAALGEAARQ
jgi:zinc/manganese transport system substrate-binding protein